MLVMTSDPFGTVDVSMRTQMRQQQAQLAQADAPAVAQSSPSPKRPKASPLSHEMERMQSAAMARHRSAMRELHASLGTIGHEMAHMKQAVYAAHAPDRGVRAAGPTPLPTGGAGPTSDDGNQYALEIQDLGAAIWKGASFDGLA